MPNLKIEHGNTKKRVSFAGEPVLSQVSATARPAGGNVLRRQRRMRQVPGLCARHAVAAYG